MVNSSLKQRSDAEYLLKQRSDGEYPLKQRSDSECKDSEDG